MRPHRRYVRNAKYPRKVPVADYPHIEALWNAGLSHREIAHEWDVTPQTIWSILDYLRREREEWENP